MLFNYFNFKFLEENFMNNIFINTRKYVKTLWICQKDIYELKKYISYQIEYFEK